MVMEAIWAKQTDAVATSIVATAVAVTAAASYGFLSHLN